MNLKYFNFETVRIGNWNFDKIYSIFTFDDYMDCSK